MKKFLFGAMILLSPQITFSQTVIKPGMDLIKHTVVNGETVLDISKKYVVDPAEIYRSNRFAIDGVKEGMVLEFYAPQKSPEIVIPSDNYQPLKELEKASNPNSKQSPKDTNIENTVAKKTWKQHKVKPGETLYGLSRMYGVSVDEIKSANTILLKNNLQSGQSLKIPVSGTIIENKQEDILSTAEQSDGKSVSGISKNDKVVQHKVAPKETLYGIAKKYNVTIEAIENQNKQLLKKGLQAGQVLTIITN